MDVYFLHFKIQCCIKVQFTYSTMNNYRAICNVALSVCPVNMKRLFSCFCTYIYTCAFTNGIVFRHGSVVELIGRSGTRKSLKTANSTRGNWMVHERLGRETSYLVFKFRLS